MASRGRKRVFANLLRIRAGGPNLQRKPQHCARPLSSDEAGLLGVLDDAMPSHRGPNLASIGFNSVATTRIRPSLGQIWPDLGKTCPTSADFRPTSPKWAELGIAEMWQTRGQIGSRSGQILPNRSEFGRTLSMSAKFGLNYTNTMATFCRIHQVQHVVAREMATTLKPLSKVSA